MTGTNTNGGTPLEAARASIGKDLGDQTLSTLLQAEHVIQRTSPIVLEQAGVLERGMIMADAVCTLRKMLDGRVMDRIYNELYGSPLGFRADHNDYSKHVVRECVIEALLKGVMVVGNEFNIISERCYITREGFTRLLREFPKLTDLRIDVGVPEYKLNKEGDSVGAVVPYRCSWLLDGVQGGIAGEVPIRMNKGQGADAVLGKADRKIKCRIYCLLTGSEMTADGEVDMDTLLAPAPRTSAAMANLEKLRSAAQAQAAANGGAPAPAAPPAAGGPTPAPAPTAAPGPATGPATPAQAAPPAAGGPTPAPAPPAAPGPATGPATPAQAAPPAAGGPTPAPAPTAAPGPATGRKRPF